MRRREVLSLIAGVAASWPLSTRAQGERVRRIGILVSGAEADPEMQARLEALRQGLARFGWYDKRNIHLDYRYAAASPERAGVMAKELALLRSEVFLAFGSFTTRVLLRETNDVPIVFVGIPDPVAEGLIASLARPGGRTTGTLLNEVSVAGKWLAMLKEFAPQLDHVAVLFNSKTSPYRHYKETADTVARSLAIDLSPNEVTSADDIERAIAAAGRRPNGGLLVPPDLTNVAHRDLIIRLAAQHRLPAVYQASFWVKAGGLMSYGADRVVAHRQAAYYIDHILRGAKPADLPVQAPSKYETTVNLKTAKALGLPVPPGLLVAADEVIE